MPAADRPAPRPEGEPYLTFGMLLADTLHEMAVHDDAPPVEPDAVDQLRDHALLTLRAAGPESMVRPFHHAYLAPTGAISQPSRPTRRDGRY
jgi:hypothetical protein